ncbi:MAG: hypothetical protein ACPLRW_06725 [Moorellales bacterium]
MRTPIQIYMADPAPEIDLEDVCGIFLARGFAPETGLQKDRMLWIVLNGVKDGAESWWGFQDEEAGTFRPEGNSEAALSGLREALEILAAKCRALYCARCSLGLEDPESGDHAPEPVSAGRAAVLCLTAEVTDWKKIAAGAA